jgi:tRNA threonylcarbamoyl adenosine modification protein (Sua5/YciO/YrdC/YwlC family)
VPAGVPEPRVVRDEAAGGLDAALAALEGGGLVVLPTDTVFGLAAKPEVSGATDRIFAAKRRPRKLTLPILVPDGERAAEVALLDDRAVHLAARYWPGPLTLVLPRTDLSRGWELGEERATVAVRIPDHPVALSLLRRTGPLAVTSANRSGEDTPEDCDGVLDALGDAVAVYLCGGPLPVGAASTVVDLTGRQHRVMREEAISAADIESSLREA